jgi:hypothetical protein
MKQFAIRIAKTAIAGMALSAGATLASDIHRFDERPDVRLAVHQIVPGAIDSIGISSKDSLVYANLAKVAAIALKQNLLPFVDSSVTGKSVPSEEIIEDFSAYCLDSDFTDKVAWRRGTGDSLWLQFSCLKDGEYPAIRERLFVMTVSADSAKPMTSNLQTNWSLIDLRLLSANIEPGSKLELKPISESGMKSPVARAVVAISGAVLLSTFVANRAMPGQQDKKFHSGVSGILAAGAASYFHFVQDMSLEKSALAGGAVSLLIGGAKEALDPTWGGHRSKQDMKANLMGAALGSVTVYLTFKFY